MTHRSERRVLLTLVLALSGVALVGATRAFDKSETFDTITVHRINVVDSDGTLRLLIANQENFPSQGLIRGKPLNPHSRSVGSAASLFFYNRDGSEQGALRWDGQQKNGSKVHEGFQYASLTLDQLEANDNLILSYGEQGGKHGASLSGEEQPHNTPLDTLLMQYDTVGHGSNDSTAKAGLRQTFVHNNFHGHERFFIGYSQDSSMVSLGDKQGRRRLVMSVEPDGTPKIQFLDENGTVVREITARTPN